MLFRNGSAFLTGVSKQAVKESLNIGVDQGCNIRAVLVGSARREPAPAIALRFSASATNLKSQQEIVILNQTNGFDSICNDTRSGTYPK